MTDKKYTIKDDGKGNYTVIDHNEPEPRTRTSEEIKLEIEALTRVQTNLEQQRQRQRQKAEPKPEPKQKPTAKQFQDSIDDAVAMTKVNKRKQVFFNIFDTKLG